MAISNSSTDVKEWSTRIKQHFCKSSHFHEPSDCSLPNHCVPGCDQPVQFLSNFELVKRNVITYELLCKRKRLFVDAEVIQFLLTIHPNTRKKHSMLVDISFTSLHGSLDCVVVSILKL